MKYSESHHSKNYIFVLQKSSEDSDDSVTSKSGMNLNKCIQTGNHMLPLGKKQHNFLAATLTISRKEKKSYCGNKLPSLDR